VRAKLIIPSKTNMLSGRSLPLIILFGIVALCSGQIVNSNIISTTLKRNSAQHVHHGQDAFVSNPADVQPSQPTQMVDLIGGKAGKGYTHEDSGFQYMFEETKSRKSSWAEEVGAADAFGSNILAKKSKSFKVQVGIVPRRKKSKVNKKVKKAHVKKTQTLGKSSKKSYLGSKSGKSTSISPSPTLSRKRLSTASPHKSTTAKVGGFAFIDLNQNGLFDPEESRLGGILVQAVSCIDNSIVSQGYTNSDGRYVLNVEKPCIRLHFHYGGNEITSKSSLFTNDIILADGDIYLSWNAGFIGVLPTKGPTTVPSPRPTANPTTKPSLMVPVSNAPTHRPATLISTQSPSHRPVTLSPTSGSPSRRPVMGIPSEQPSSRPVTLNPSQPPSRRPVTGSLSRHPSRRPVSASPSEQPSRRPFTAGPSEQPSRRPVTLSPTQSPNRRPVTLGPSQSPNRRPVSAIPSEQPSLTASNPSSQPSRRPVSTTPSLQPSGHLVQLKPSQSPSRPVTYSPSEQPSRRPVTLGPAESPSRRPVTLSPSQSPSRRPTSASPSFPTFNRPVTGNPSDHTTSPTQLAPSEPTNIRNETSVLTYAPTTGPTPFELSFSYSFSPSSETKSSRPETSNPSRSPSRSPVTSVLTTSPMQFEPTKPTNIPTETSVFTDAPTTGPTPSFELSFSYNLNPSSETPSRRPTTGSPTSTPYVPKPITLTPTSSQSSMPTSRISFPLDSRYPSISPSAAPSQKSSSADTINQPTNIQIQTDSSFPTPVSSEGIVVDEEVIVIIDGFGTTFPTTPPFLDVEETASVPTLDPSDDPSDKPSYKPSIDLVSATRSPHMSGTPVSFPDISPLEDSNEPSVETLPVRATVEPTQSNKSVSPSVHSSEEQLLNMSSEPSMKTQTVSSLEPTTIFRSIKPSARSHKSAKSSKASRTQSLNSSLPPSSGPRIETLEPSPSNMLSKASKVSSPKPSDSSSQPSMGMGPVVLPTITPSQVASQTSLDSSYNPSSFPTHTFNTNTQNVESSKSSKTSPKLVGKNNMMTSPTQAMEPTEATYFTPSAEPSSKNSDEFSSKPTTNQTLAPSGLNFDIPQKSQPPTYISTKTGKSTAR